jgi:hypothetical protein
MQPPTKIPMTFFTQKMRNKLIIGYRHSPEKLQGRYYQIIHAKKCPRIKEYKFLGCKAHRVPSKIKYTAKDPPKKVNCALI